MVLIILISALVTLFLTTCIGTSLLPSVVLWPTCERSSSRSSSSLCVLIVRVVCTTPRVYVVNRFLFWRNLLSSKRIDFYSTTRFNSFSLRIVYSYASFGVLVGANNSSAILSLFMCAVNKSRTHSSSQSPQSARDASSTKSELNCSKLSVFFCFRQIKLYLSKAIIWVVTKISSRVAISSCVETVCSSKLGLFCCICLFCPLAPKHKNR